MRLTMIVGLFLALMSMSDVRAQSTPRQLFGRQNVDPSAPAPRPPTKPFSDLFKPNSPVPQVMSAFRLLSTMRPTVRCGMTLMPVDPEFDKAIRKPAPAQPQPSVRAVPTPPCEQPPR